MLVQAKRVHRRYRRLTLDLRANADEQMSRLFRTAEIFQVLAAYMLPLGSVAFRSGLTCGARHTIDCERCRRALRAIRM